VLQAYRLAHTVIQRHIKVRGAATPYDPKETEYFEKRRGFAWRTYPIGKTRALAAGTDTIATQDATSTKPDCRITSAEADLRKA
jgi:transglutaminase-like putative cysteine protease